MELSEHILVEKTPEGEEDFQFQFLDMLAGRIAIEYEICGETLRKLIIRAHKEAQIVKHKRKPTCNEIEEQAYKLAKEMKSRKEN